MSNLPDLLMDFLKVTSATTYSITRFIEEMDEGDFLKIPVASKEVIEVCGKYGLVTSRLNQKEGSFYGIYICMPSVFRDENPTLISKI